MLKAAICAALALALAGCLTTEERAQQQAQQMAALRAQWQKIDDGKCRSWGAQPGTQQYLDCMEKLSTARTGALAQIESANAQAAAQQSAARSAALIQAGTRMMAPPPPAPVIMPAPAPLLPPPIHCTSVGMGNTVNTNCY